MLSALVGGCGGDSSSGTTTDGLGASRRAEPTREFIIPGGDNTIQYFGREGSNVEREEASAVVETWDRARAAGDWQEDCRYLSRPYIDLLVRDAETVSKGKATTCTQALAFFGSMASGDFAKTTTGPIDSLRLSQGTAYAQYHGRRGVDWFVPLKKEDGDWVVTAAAPIHRQGQS